MVLCICLMELGLRGGVADTQMRGEFLPQKLAAYTAVINTMPGPARGTRGRDTGGVNTRGHASPPPDL